MLKVAWDQRSRHRASDESWRVIGRVLRGRHGRAGLLRRRVVSARICRCRSGSRRRAAAPGRGHGTIVRSLFGVGRVRGLGVIGCGRVTVAHTVVLGGAAGEAVRLPAGRCPVVTRDVPAGAVVAQKLCASADDGEFRQRSTVGSGELPTGVAATATAGYVANAESNTVSVLNLTQNPPAVHDDGPGRRVPVAVAVERRRRARVRRRLRRGRRSTSSLLRPTRSPPRSRWQRPGTGLRLSSANVYVADLLSGTVNIIPRRRTRDRTITLSGTLTPAPSELAFVRHAPVCR